MRTPPGRRWKRIAGGVGRPDGYGRYSFDCTVESCEVALLLTP